MTQRVYKHPQGATAIVYEDGSMSCVDKNGKAKKTSATPEKLAAGHGGWVEVASAGADAPAALGSVVIPAGFGRRKPMKFQQATWDVVKIAVSSDLWWLQQKVDGVRAQLVIGLDGVAVRSGSGEPLKSTVAGPVATRIMGALGVAKTKRSEDAATFVLDGEILGGAWWLFDLVTDEARTTTPYEERLEALETFLGTVNVPGLQLLPTARTEDEKARLVARVLKEGAEGVLLKRRDSGYTYDARVEHSLKWKATHTVDCVVTGRNVKKDCNAVLALYDGDMNLVDVGRTSMIGKPDVPPGSVLEVRYLYAGAGGRLVQPTVMRARPDKKAAECTTDQLVFVNKDVLL